MHGRGQGASVGSGVAWKGRVALIHPHGNKAFFLGVLSMRRAYVLRALPQGGSESAFLVLRYTCLQSVHPPNSQSRRVGPARPPLPTAPLALAALMIPLHGLSFSRRVQCSSHAWSGRFPTPHRLECITHQAHAKP